MKIFNYNFSTAVVQDYGLHYPERVQLYTHTRLSSLLNVWNFITGRDCKYIVWKHAVHLSGPGLYLEQRDQLNSLYLRGLIQQAERSPVKALFKSLERR